MGDWQPVHSVYTGVPIERGEGSIQIPLQNFEDLCNYLAFQNVTVAPTLYQELERLRGSRAGAAPVEFKGEAP